MRHRATPLAVLALVAALAACGSKPQNAAAREQAPADSAPPPAAVTTKPPVAFYQCHSCHSSEPGQNGIGPSLFGIVGTKAAAVPGYAFSEALKKHADTTWDAATLDRWLQGPQQFAPGSKMVVSIPDPERRKQIIDYLQTLK